MPKIVHSHAAVWQYIWWDRIVDGKTHQSPHWAENCGKPEAKKVSRKTGFAKLDSYSRIKSTQHDSSCIISDPIDEDINGIRRIVFKRPCGPTLLCRPPISHPHWKYKVWSCFPSMMDHHYHQPIILLKNQFVNSPVRHVKVTGFIQDHSIWSRSVRILAWPYLHLDGGGRIWLLLNSDWAVGCTMVWLSIIDTGDSTNWPIRVGFAKFCHCSGRKSWRGHI